MHLMMHKFCIWSRWRRNWNNFEAGVIAQKK